MKFTLTLEKSSVETENVPGGLTLTQLLLYARSSKRPVRRMYVATAFATDL